MDHRIYDVLLIPPLENNEVMEFVMTRLCMLVQVTCAVTHRTVTVVPKDWYVELLIVPMYTLLVSVGSEKVDGKDCREVQLSRRMFSICCFFFFNDTATTEIYTLSLHDALPISPRASTTSASATMAGVATTVPCEA